LCGALVRYYHMNLYMTSRFTGLFSRRQKKASSNKTKKSLFRRIFRLSTPPSPYKPSSQHDLTNIYGDLKEEVKDDYTDVKEMERGKRDTKINKIKTEQKNGKINSNEARKQIETIRNQTTRNINDAQNIRRQTMTLIQKEKHNAQKELKRISVENNAINALEQTRKLGGKRRTRRRIRRRQ
jgi:hypothetical protein